MALAAVPAAAAPPTLTLKATPAIVTYGGSTALSGTLAPAKVNQKVGISAQDCGQGAFKTKANVKTTATGGFSRTSTRNDGAVDTLSSDRLVVNSVIARSHRPCFAYAAPIPANASARELRSPFDSAT